MCGLFGHVHGWRKKHVNNVWAIVSHRGSGRAVGDGVERSRCPRSDAQLRLPNKVVPLRNGLARGDRTSPCDLRWNHSGQEHTGMRARASSGANWRLCKPMPIENNHGQRAVEGSWLRRARVMVAQGTVTLDEA